MLIGNEYFGSRDLIVMFNASRSSNAHRPDCSRRHQSLNTAANKLVLELRLKHKGDLRPDLCK